LPLGVAFAKSYSAYFWGYNSPTSGNDANENQNASKVIEQDCEGLVPVPVQTAVKAMFTDYFQRAAKYLERMHKVMSINFI
jgi:hypothetical protein